MDIVFFLLAMEFSMTSSKNEFFLMRILGEFMSLEVGKKIKEKISMSFTIESNFILSLRMDLKIESLE